MASIIPVTDETSEFSSIGKLERQNARHKVTIEPMNSIYSDISRKYKHTTSYSLSNAREQSLYSGKNNLKNRFIKFINEDYVIVEQSNYERLNYLFTAILLILTIFLIYYSTQRYNLKLVPESIIHYEEMSDEDKYNLNSYNRLNKSINIIKSLSVAYIIGLSTVRIFKRTTS